MINATSHIDTPPAGLTVMQARGKVIRAKVFCERPGHCEPGRRLPDTRRARSAAPTTAATPGVGCSLAGCRP